MNMQNATRLQRMLFTACGCYLLGLGIGLCDHAGLGTDPFTVLLVGMQVHIGGTIGILNAGVNFLMILFGLYADRSMVSMATFAAMVMTSLGMDTVGFVAAGRSQNMVSAGLFLAIGILIYSFGAAMAIAPDAGYDPYNCFLIGLQKLTHGSYKVIRWSVEIVFLTVGWMLGGIVGVGTVLNLILVAPFVELFAGKLRCLFKAD